MDEKTVARMGEFFGGIENAVLLCADEKEQLMMACCMTQKAGEIYDQILGKRGRIIMFMEAATH